MKKRIFYFILGGILFTTVSVLAYNLSSNEVFYKKVNNEDMTVVQAIDDIYTKVNTQIETAQSSCPTGNACISNDAFGTPTSYAWGDPDAANPTEVGTHEVYVGKYADGQKGVCINRNGTEYCFRANNWFAEREHLQQVFSGENDSCDVYKYIELCYASDFNCYVRPNGHVECSGYGSYEICYVDGDGTVYCGNW